MGQPSIWLVASSMSPEPSPPPSLQKTMSLLPSHHCLFSDALLRLKRFPDVEPQGKSFPFWWRWGIHTDANLSALWRREERWGQQVGERTEWVNDRRISTSASSQGWTSDNKVHPKWWFSWSSGGSSGLAWASQIDDGYEHSYWSPEATPFILGSKRQLILVKNKYTQLSERKK